MTDDGATAETRDVELERRRARGGAGADLEDASPASGAR